jgi:HEAT repeat protein
MLSAVFSLIILFSAGQVDEQRTFLGKTLEGWRERVRSKSATPHERRDALWAIGCFGPEGRPAVPDLTELVRRGEFKDEAIGALTAIGANPELAVPRLIERFVKAGCAHRTEMGTIIFNSGPEDALVRIGEPAVPALLEVLQGPNREMRVCAAAALGRIGPAARQAAPALIRAVESPVRDGLAELLRRRAVVALGQIGPDAGAIVPTLNRMLDEALKGPHDNHWDTSDLIRALDGIGAAPAQRLVEKLLRGDEPEIALKITMLGSRTRNALPALRRALLDKRYSVRVSAAVAIAFSEPSGTEPLPVLMEALDHPDDDVIDVSWAVLALAKLGPKARPALRPLADLARKRRDFGGICKALAQIDPDGKECVPALVSVLKQDYYVDVDCAANCLGLLGPRAKGAVPALSALLTRDFGEPFANGYEPQASAAKALRQIGPEARSAIPALISALKFRNHDRARQVELFDQVEWLDCSGAAASAEVLGSFGAEAKIAVPALTEAIQAQEKDDASWLVRLAAIEALGKIGPDARPAIPVLRRLMAAKEKDPQYLPVILAALYRLAPDGKGLAMKWLDSGVKERFGFRMREWVPGRAMLMGVMGRTSVEADYLIGLDLEKLDSIFAQARLEADDPPMPVRQWFERLGRFGVGGRLAIPRLREFQKHPSPWVRMWATEALAQITAKATSVSFHPPSGVDAPCSPALD